jgi:hypothetical protein
MALSLDRLGAAEEGSWEGSGADLPSARAEARVAKLKKTGKSHEQTKSEHYQRYANIGKDASANLEPGNHHNTNTNTNTNINTKNSNNNSPVPLKLSRPLEPTKQTSDPDNLVAIDRVEREEIARAYNKMVLGPVGAESVAFIRKIIDSLLKAPSGDAGLKFHKIKMANAKVERLVIQSEGSLDLLLALGFAIREFPSAPTEFEPSVMHNYLFYDSTQGYRLPLYAMQMLVATEKNTPSGEQTSNIRD